MLYLAELDANGKQGWGKQRKTESAHFIQGVKERESSGTREVRSERMGYLLGIVGDGRLLGA